MLIQSNTPRRSSAREYHSIPCLSARCTRVRPAYLLSSNYRTVAASPSVISRVSCCPVSQAQVNHFSFRHDMFDVICSFFFFFLFNLRHLLKSALSAGDGSASAKFAFYVICVTFIRVIHEIRVRTIPNRDLVNYYPILIFKSQL